MYESTSTTVTAKLAAGRGTQTLEQCKALVMSIDEWWPRLEPSTRDWLIGHNGEALPAEVAAEIRRAGGTVAAEVSSVGEEGANESFLQDDAIDWIETVANEEQPGTG